MRKRTVILLLALIFSVYNYAQRFESDGIYYCITSSDEVSVISKGEYYEGHWSFYEGYYEGVINLPSTVQDKNNGKDYKVSGIGEEAFYHCAKLDSISIPDGITTIGSYSFEGCTSLKSIVIPKSVTRICSGAFMDCNSLDYISVDSQNKVYDSRDNCNAIIESIDTIFYDYGWDGTVYEDGTKKNTLILACKNTVIPGSVTTIYGVAFHGTKGLTSIIIPPSVTRITGVPFASCSDLESIIVHPDNEFYDSRDNSNALIETRTNTLISGCKNTIIPSSISRIGNGAFYECSGLKSVILPDKLTYIGSNAFEGCSELSEIHMPANVDSIGIIIYEIWYSDGGFSIDTAYYNPFARCSNLKKITVDAANPVYDSRNGCNAIVETGTNKLLAGCSNTLIANNVTEIANSAFWGSGLTSIIIPENVRTIGEEAFAECTLLKDISFPDNITEIKWSTFYGCSSLTSVAIPYGVTCIGQSAFEGCTSLVSVYMPESIEEIGYDAFMNCQSLESIVIPDRVKTIRGGAFQGCVSLSSIVIPEGVTDIGGFSGCTGLTSISIPSSLNEWWYYSRCFAGCNNIDTIYWNYPTFSSYILDNLFDNSQPPIKHIVLGDSVNKLANESYHMNDFSSVLSLTMCTKTPDHLLLDNNCLKTIDLDKCTLYVPYGARYAYSNTFPWSKFKNIVATDEIQHGAIVNGIRYEITLFQDRTASVIHSNYSGSVVIPASVTIDGIQYGVSGIETEAFSDCNELTSIRIPQTIDSLVQRTFENCTSLTDVVFEGSPYIDKYVFIDCPNIQSVTSAGVIPGHMQISNPFIGGEYESISVNSGTKYAAYDSTLMRNITKIVSNGCEIQMENIPSGVYRISVGVLPSPDSKQNNIHPIIKGVSDSVDVVLFDSVRRIRPNRPPTPYYIQNDISCEYDSVLIVDSLVINEYYDKLIITLSSSTAAAYASYLLIDRVFFEPLDEMPVVRYAGPFTEGVFNNATLYVPESAVESYRSADGWKLFKNIAIDTAVEPIRRDNRHRIGRPVIYDMLGRKVSSDSLEELQPGLYIINGRKYLKR